jgi:hypothetical protein
MIKVRTKMTSERTNYQHLFGGHAYGNASIAIGIALVFLAILILFTNMRINVSRDWLGNATGVSYEFPNVPYSIGLAVVGIIFGAVGSASRMKAKPQIQPQPPPPFSKTPSFCRYCGTQNTPNAVFCSRCGEKLT